MVDFEERIVTGNKYRICTDPESNKWDRISFWTKASDVEMNNGRTAEAEMTDLNNKMGVLITGGTQTTTSSADGGSNVFTFTKNDGTTATFTVKNGSKGDKGTDGTTPTVKAAAGANIGAVGTPSVTASTSGTTTTFTFNYLKGAKGDKGDTGAKGDTGVKGDTGAKGDPGVNRTTTALASAGANGLLRALSGNTSQYLRGDGTWQTVTAANSNSVSGAMKTVRHTLTYGCPANAAYSYSINLSSQSGYTPFSIGRWYTGSWSVVPCLIDFDPGAGKINIVLRNVTNIGESNVVFWVDVVYIK